MIFEGLNEKQIEAVRATEGPVLVISGPGSGKTRCLTHRVAFLIQKGIRPENILAITFTNKAAQEMRDRISKLLELEKFLPTGKAGKMKTASAMPMLGTFHSVCLRILRKEVYRLGYGSSFSIFDANDQMNLVKRIMTDIEIDTKRYNPRAVLSKISNLKSSLISPEKFDPKDFFSKLVSRVYSLYQGELKKANALDFDDIIGFTVTIFRESPEVLANYQKLWPYILVDEYQDTSHDQYCLIKLLAEKSKNIFAIGDDAQSIYAFRDADIRNILSFQKDYPEARIIFLEQNYRSTQNIITAAQNIISNNQNQVPKSLWTDNHAGEKILVSEVLNERDEANFIVSEIRGLAGQGYKPSDFTILYRTHAQSRAIEEALVFEGLPYQIIGGIKFYERKEIKDILAYLKFVANPSDIASFERIYNIPTRGLGEMFFERISSRPEGTIIEAMASLAKESTGKKALAIKSFSRLITDLIIKSEGESKATSLLKYLIEKVDYEEYLKSLSGLKNGPQDVEERMENIKELLTVAKKYDNLGSAREGIAKLLEEIALVQAVDNLKEAEDRITLMTIHSSKGLEFPIVFIAGMEEGLFPHSRATLSLDELEEERRLCYVAITRAKHKLILTHSRYRNIFGQSQNNLPSRFIGEIPANVIDYKKSAYNNDFYEDETIDY